MTIYVFHGVKLVFGLFNQVFFHKLNLSFSLEFYSFIIVWKTHGNIRDSSFFVLSVDIVNFVLINKDVLYFFSFNLIQLILFFVFLFKNFFVSEKWKNIDYRFLFVFKNLHVLFLWIFFKEITYLFDESIDFVQFTNRSMLSTGAGPLSLRFRSNKICDATAIQRGNVF